jgi:hypothetical protein
MHSAISARTNNSFTPLDFHQFIFSEIADFISEHVFFNSFLNMGNALKVLIYTNYFTQYEVIKEKALRRYCFCSHLKRKRIGLNSHKAFDFFFVVKVRKRTSEQVYNTISTTIRFTHNCINSDFGKRIIKVTSNPNTVFQLNLEDTAPSCRR